MNRTNNDIRDHFDFFNELVNDNKVVLNALIHLEHKKSNARWLTGQTNVQHVTINDDIFFFVERSKRDSKYGVKLRCPSLTSEPFFRFDSDGPAHRNEFPEIPLEDQVVKTPHFNSYREDGKPIAYQNETLKKAIEAAEIAKDINFGVSLFCMETNSRLSNGEFPMVIDKSPELEYGSVENINFDHISFE